MPHDAIALLEVASIAQGLYLCDVVVKKAPVRLLRAEAVSPGKFLVMFTGDVAAVAEAFAEGVRESEGELVDMLHLPFLHPQVRRVLGGEPQATSLDAVGIVECHTVAAAIAAADAAVKGAEVALLELRTARGLGGKAYFTLTGAQPAVEAAIEASGQACSASGTLLRTRLIPRPHEDFAPVVLHAGAEATAQGA